MWAHQEVTWWHEFRDLEVLQLLTQGSQPSTVAIWFFYTNIGEQMPLGKYPPFTLEFYLLIPQFGESASTLLRKVTGRGS